MESKWQQNLYSSWKVKYYRSKYIIFPGTLTGVALRMENGGREPGTGEAGRLGGARRYWFLCVLGVSFAALREGKRTRLPSAGSGITHPTPLPCTLFFLASCQKTQNIITKLINLGLIL